MIDEKTIEVPSVPPPGAAKKGKAAIKSPLSTAPVKATMEDKAPKLQKSTHPPTAIMVLAALDELHERNGSSVQAIKKYIANNYEVDIDRIKVHMKKYLKSAVADGMIIQTKGIGANGSFKLPAQKPSKKKTATVDIVKPIEKMTQKARARKPVPEPVDEVEAAVPEKTTKKKATKKVTAQQPAIELIASGKEKTKPMPASKKKTVAKKKVAIEQEEEEEQKQEEMVKAPKSPSKTKKARSPVAKPKAPKPKKLSAAKPAKKA